MGERKGQNHYYPPDFDPKKHGSLNGYHGTHALRERAKKIKEGILIIRFEMPYNIWCGGCEKHIGMGVRYNAEKTKVGMYYTTPIYKFRMKCHMCDNYFEIQTDPQNFTYVIVEGARRKEERWKAEDNEQIVTEDREVVKKLVNDPMFKLDHDHTDKQNIKKAKPGLGSITELQAGKKDDYLLNKLARSRFRNAKNQLKAADLVDRALLEKSSLDIKLVKEHDDDVRLAGLMKYKNVQSSEERLKIKREEIMNRPIFQNLTKAGSPRTPVAALVTPLSSKVLVRRKTDTGSPDPSSFVEAVSQNTDTGVLVRRKTDTGSPDPSTFVTQEAVSPNTDTGLSSVECGAAESAHTSSFGVNTRTAEKSQLACLSALGGYGSSGSDSSLDGLS